MATKLPTSGPVDRATALRLIWNATGKDYRGKLNGRRSVMVYSEQHGTCLAYLDDLSDEEIRRKLPKAFTYEPNEAGR